MASTLGIPPSVGGKETELRKKGRKGERERWRRSRLSRSHSPSLFVHTCVFLIHAWWHARVRASNAGRSYPSRGSSRVKPLSNVARARSTQPGLLNRRTRWKTPLPSLSDGTLIRLVKIAEREKGNGDVVLSVFYETCAFLSREEGAITTW